jgi:hypothetical protein
MKTILLTFSLWGLALHGLAQSKPVIQKARAILAKDSNLIAVYAIPLNDGQKGLLVNLMKDSAIHERITIESNTDTLALTLHDSAIADSVNFYEYISIIYRTPGQMDVDKRFIFVYQMTDKLFVRRRQKRK